MSSSQTFDDDAFFVVVRREDGRRRCCRLCRWLERSTHQEQHRAIFEGPPTPCLADGAQWSWEVNTSALWHLDQSKVIKAKTACMIMVWPIAVVPLNVAHSSILIDPAEEKQRWPFSVISKEKEILSGASPGDGARTIRKPIWIVELAPAPSLLRKDNAIPSVPFDVPPYQN